MGKRQLLVEKFFCWSLYVVSNEKFEVVGRDYPYGQILMQIQVGVYNTARHMSIHDL